MTALAFSRLSKIPPMPNQVDHGNNLNVGYTCHMAAMHWAFMAIGMSQNAANAAVGEFALATCPGCSGGRRGNMHGSLSPSTYGDTFCKTAVHIPRLNLLAQMVDVGDVLITDSKMFPAHTMVVRQKRGANHITIRGFNNFGTLGTGTRSQYDPVSHNIAQTKYWHDPNTGRFGLYGVRLYVIKHSHFMRVIRVLARKLLG